MNEQEFVQLASEPAPRSQLTIRRLRNAIARLANYVLAACLGVMGLGLSLTWMSIRDEPHAGVNMVILAGVCLLFIGLPLAAYLASVYTRAAKLAAHGRLHPATVGGSSHNQHRGNQYTGVALTFEEAGVRYQTGVQRSGWFQPPAHAFVFAAPEISNGCYAILPEHGSSTELVTRCST